MSRNCGPCTCANRLMLDERLRSGSSCASVAQEFGFSPDAIERHARFHCGRAPARSASTASDPVAMLKELITEFDELSRNARLKNDIRAATDAAKQKLEATQKLLEIQHSEREQLKQTSENGSNGVQKIPIQLLDQIIANVENEYAQCSHCGAYSIKKSKAEVAQSLHNA